MNSMRDNKNTMFFKVMTLVLVCFSILSLAVQAQADDGSHAQSYITKPLQLISPQAGDKAAHDLAEKHGSDAAAHKDDAHAQAGADHHADGHHAEHSSAGLPQLEVKTYVSQLFWLFISFGLMYIIFSKKSLPEISGTIENRRQHINSDLEHAEKLREDAEAAQSEYEQSLAKAKETFTTELAKAQDKIQKKTDKQNAAFKEKADEQIKALEARLVKEQDAIMSDMNNIAAEVASEAAQKIAGINPGVEKAQTIVESLNGKKKAKAA